jgi:hypothetical protein
MKRSSMTVVVIDAVDWGMNDEQLPATSDFHFVTGRVVGFLVKETKESITLTQQWFFDDGIRKTLTIPKCTILHRTDLKLKKKKG